MHLFDPPPGIDQDEIEALDSVVTHMGLLIFFPFFFFLLLFFEQSKSVYCSTCAAVDKL